MTTRIGQALAGAVVMTIALVVAPLRADEPAASTKPLEAQAAFERLKGLAGTWTIAEAPAEDPSSRIVYRLTGGGTAVVEELFPGSDHAMMTVYHLDGDELVLTHYCAAGNQPHLRLNRKSSTPDDLRFDFVSGTGFDPAKDMHMHEGRIRITGDNAAVAEWTGYNKGQPTGTHTFTLRRMEK
jgi:hypothetical protein